MDEAPAGAAFEMPQAGRAVVSHALGVAPTGAALEMPQAGRAVMSCALGVGRR